MAYELIQKTIREIQDQGYSVLPRHFSTGLVDACREAFLPRLIAHIESGQPPNRGSFRHSLAMPFEPPCFAPEFFFDPDVLSIMRGLMDDRSIADQWGCDVPLRGSEYQGVHADYRRPLFPESPDLQLPAYAIVASFALTRIAKEHGPIEIAPRSHRMPRAEAVRALETGVIGLQAVTLEIGDVLIRHPWALHRGTPNTSDTPRPLATIRYVRRWYADASRDVNAIPRATWESLDAEQQSIMRFPVVT
jgi:hypothetical protein